MPDTQTTMEPLDMSHETPHTYEEQPHPLPQKISQTEKLYQMLQDEFNHLPTNFLERQEWRKRLRKDHGQQFIEKFFRWMDNDLATNLENPEQLSTEEFATSLEQANWKENNETL
ncbi:MAG: hypothetical protein L6R41_008197, partial [Letrouitia leprolyta]